MKKLKLKLWKMVRPVLQGISFTSVAFVFQACYGVCRDSECDKNDTLIEGTVISAHTGNAIRGIQVTHEKATVLTDIAGKFSFYTGYDKKVVLQFKDIDADKNGGLYRSKDTVIATQNMSRIVMTVPLDNVEIKN